MRSKKGEDEGKKCDSGDQKISLPAISSYITTEINTQLFVVLNHKIMIYHGSSNYFCIKITYVFWDMKKGNRKSTINFSMNWKFVFVGFT